MCGSYFFDIGHFMGIEGYVRRRMELFFQSKVYLQLDLLQAFLTVREYTVKNLKLISHT